MSSNGGVEQLSQSDGRFEFGSFRVDLDQKILWRDGQVVPLGPKVVHTLVILISNRDQVVSKEDLVGQIWGDTVVGENSLAHNIFVLRKALREDSDGFAIETVPRRGYRFCQTLPPPDAQAFAAPGHAEGVLPTSVPIQSVSDVRPPWLRLGAIAAVLLLVFTGVLLSKHRLFFKRTSALQDPASIRLYAKAVLELRRYNAPGARELLNQALEIEPKFALAHSALADALSVLGYDAKSEDEAKLAFELSGKLPLEERQVVEGRYRMAIHDWKKAADVYRSLFASFPDNIDYGLLLASAQNASSDPNGSLNTLGVLRRLSAPQGYDPRISLLEYEAWKSIGDFGQMEESLSQAADTARRQGALLLLARAQNRLCWVQRVRAQAAGRKNCEEAQQIYSAAGDRRGQAESLRFLGDIVSSTDVDGAIRYYKQALTKEREIGSPSGQSMMMTLLATEYSSQGDHITAKSMYEKALAIELDLDNRLDAAGQMINIGAELYALGQLDEANRIYHDSLKEATAIGNGYIQSLARYNIGQLQQARGELGEAQSSYQSALVGFQKAGNKEYDIGLMKSLGEVSIARGDIGNARVLFQQAISLPQAPRQKLEAAEAEMAFLQLALEQGESPAKLEPALRRIVEIFRTGNSIGSNNAIVDQALSASLLARCLLSEGKTDQALRMTERAEQLSTKVEPSVRQSIALASIRTRFAIAGNSYQAQALERLRKTRAEAHRLGYLGMELESELAIGEIEVRSGNQTGGRTHLLAVEKAASDSGLVSLARKAVAVGRQ
jgi:DNA-binding winged helix-turn-helix (wHTH) protein/tetratricopeptide (TPR) repeat protein